MSKCSVCGNEKILCVCPKGLGAGAEASTGDAKDKAATKVAHALLMQHMDIVAQHPQQLHEFIDELRIILNAEAAETVLELLEEGVVTDTEQEAFIEQFNNLNPNMAMLDALSHRFVLNVFPSPANEFVAGIQQALTGLDGFPAYPDSDGGDFQQALDIYARYYQDLTDEQQVILSVIFWGQIKRLGTPIIESNPEKPSECKVYFLLPKDDELLESTEVPGTKKDLYLQGDVHGYDTTDGRQRVKEFHHTGIMLLMNTLPRDAIVAYRYIQLEPSLGKKTPTQHHGSALVEEPPTLFFPDEEDAASSTLPIIPAETVDATAQFWGEDNQLTDKFSRHSAPHPYTSERIFRVSADPIRAQIPDMTPEWSKLLSSSESESSYFLYHNTLYSDIEGNLHHCDGDIKPDASPEDLFINCLPAYADFTRAVHVFKPSSGIIDEVVVVNDGMQYLASGAMNQFEALVTEEKLSPNTAFVFVTQLPGLSKTISLSDPKTAMPGIGTRYIDYECGIDRYVDFIRNQLIPGLTTPDFRLPEDASHRVMIGASYSGTASVYIAEKHPELFGAVIAQSPSPSNRAILRDIVKAEASRTSPRAQIHLSCGFFEQPDFAANTNLPYARELSSKLKIPLHDEGFHGHQFPAWIENLGQALPEALSASHENKASGSLHTH